MESMYQLLQHRRSCRKYQPTAVPEKDIETLLHAALMSPSSKRMNPWEFIAVTDKAIIEKLSHCKEHSSTFIAEAPLAIVVLANIEKSDVWVEDCSIASIIIQLVAEDLGLGSCWVQIRNRFTKNHKVSSNDYVKETLHIPDNYAVEAIISIGYKVEERKPFDEEKLQIEKIHYQHFSH
jgi:nitroreductase